MSAAETKLIHLIIANNDKKYRSFTTALRIVLRQQQVELWTCAVGEY